MPKEVPFIAQVRVGGGKSGSILITVPKEVATLLKLSNKDYVKCVIKKIEPEEI